MVVLWMWQFTGFCTLGIEVQEMENDALRQLHRMQDQQTGVLIRAVTVSSSSTSTCLASAHWTPN